MLMRVIKPLNLEESKIFIGEVVSIERKEEKIKIYQSDLYLGYTFDDEAFEIYNKITNFNILDNTKLCQHCLKEVPIIDFHNNTKEYDRLNKVCKKCYNNNQNQRRNHK